MGKITQVNLKTNFKDLVHKTLTDKFGDSILPTTIDRRIETYWKTFNIIGGLELGTVIEAYGGFASGKSLLMMICGAAIQKMGGIFFCFNTEAANRDKEWLTRIIPDLKYNEIVFYQPESIEHVFESIREIIKVTPVKGVPVFIGIDSISSSSSKHEIEVGLEKSDMTRALKISAGLRLINNPLSKKPMVVFMTSQMSTKITRFGGYAGPTGGMSPEFYSSLVVRLSKNEYIVEKIGKREKTLGRNCTLEIMKGRFSPAGRKVEFECFNDTGISSNAGLLDLLILNRVITQDKAWLEYKDKKFQKCDFEKFIKENPELARIKRVD